MVWDDGPVQIADWLSERFPAAPAGPVDAATSGSDARSAVPVEELDEVRADLEHAAADTLATLRDHLDPTSLPLRLHKGRLADLERCERSAVARAEVVERASGWAVLRGTALDHYVAHQLVAGRVREPVADLRSMLDAAADHETLDALDGMDEPSAHEVLAPLASAVADAWSGVDPAWMPRVQSGAALALAEGAMTCRGVLDVELGGPGTGRPGVLFELKSAEPSGGHPHEVYLYALLVSLRDRCAPSVAARWYPGGGPVALEVTVGMLHAASARLAAGLRRWAELQAGDTPVERPGGWCSWCPDRDGCPSSTAAGHDLGEHDPADHDPADHGGGADG